MRLRGRDSWELRVYCGIDAASKHPRYVTRTVGAAGLATRAEVDAEANAVRASVNTAALAGRTAELLVP